MEFTLTYRGLLRANGNSNDKQRIRRKIHQQLKVLWQQLPLSSSTQYLIDPPAPPGSIALIRPLSSFRFAPLVSCDLALIAELTITFLRPEEPGHLITQGGDIDNRLKTLLDALRMPKVAFSSEFLENWQNEGHVWHLAPVPSPTSDTASDWFCKI